MYLERYLQGEHEQVWAELQILGSAIHQEELYQDVWLVVQETMRRVRQNLDLLLPRLIECGFVFGYGYRLSYFFKRSLPLYEPSDPLILGNGYLYALDMARMSPPVFLPADLAQRNKDISSHFSPKNNVTETREDPLIPDMKKHVEHIEEEIGVLPLSIKAWYELVGGVNVYGFHPAWAQWYCEHISHNKDDYYALMSFCDPLVVAPLTSNWKKFLYTAQFGSQRTHILEFAPDNANKDLFSGGPSPYVIAIPDSSVDAPLLFLDDYLTPEGEPLTFVQYLRFCFAWAGFPKMSRWSGFPRENIARLTKDFLPF